MKEYVDRKAIMEDINDLKQSPWYNDDTGFDTKQARQDGVKCVVELIINPAPIEDVVEVRHGKWGKEKWMKTNQHICSLCHSTVRVHPESVEYKWCPYCGAKMDGKTGGLI